MYWKVEFRQPYDAADAIERCVLVTSKTADEDHVIRMFRDYYPNAEQVSVECVQGVVEAVISDFDVLLQWEK